MRGVGRETRLEPVEVGGAERGARLGPLEEGGAERGARLELACTIGFDHPLLRHQHRSVGIDAFREALAPARTFGFEAEIEALRAAGLIRGGSLENALVMGADGWLNPERVRFEDEPVRHKLLDAVGDLALIGASVVARYVGVRAGHALNVALARRVRASSGWLEPL
jgi:UDP-3-O-[3-hydroxymyristoyl] N-acetylglucosamine deacetylase